MSHGKPNPALTSAIEAVANLCNDEFAKLDNSSGLHAISAHSEIKRTSIEQKSATFYPSQFAHLLIQYQQHPEAKSLAPDGTPCTADTRGLLKRAHVLAGEVRYIGKETDHKWEQGDGISLLELAATEYGRKGKVVASADVKAKISNIGINKCARESGFDRKNFVRKLVRGIPVKRNSYNEFVRWLQGYMSSS
jgi:hypothetical protein